MTRLIIIVLMSFAWIGQANAQRLLKGQKGLQVTASAVDGFKLKKEDKQAFAFGIAYSNYRQSGNHWVFGVEYLEKKHLYKKELIPVSQITAEGGYYLNFIASPRKVVLCSLGLSAMAGYETVNWGKELLFDGATLMSKDAMLYGGAISLEIETYLSDRTIFLVHARERVLFGSSISKTHFQVGIGFKFMINN